MRVEKIYENEDVTTLERLCRQEEAVLFFNSVQQFTERELSKLNDTNASNAIKLNQDFILESSFDSNYSPDETSFSTFAKENTSYESGALQLDENALFNYSLLDYEDIIVGNRSFTDCEAIDYNDVVDEFRDFEESQVDAVLTEYLASVDSSLESVDDIKIDDPKIDRHLFNVRVHLKRLSESTIESITKVGNDTSPDKKTKFHDHCQHCDNLLTYFCKKCKGKCFTTYNDMILHGKMCKFNEISTDVYTCQNCDFKSLYKKSIIIRQSKTERELSKTGENTKVKNRKQNKFTVQYERDYSKAFERLCNKCNDVVSSTSSKDDTPCEQCSTRLYYRCIKCGGKSKNHKRIIHHLKTKCLSKTYTCRWCQFVTTKWKSIQRHAKHQHPQRINCKYCDFETNKKYRLTRHLFNKHKIGNKFDCNICKSYWTNVANRLESHILRRHSKKKVDASRRTFQCPICTRYSTNSQQDLWRHIDRRHCEK